MKSPRFVILGAALCGSFFQNLSWADLQASTTTVTSSTAPAPTPASNDVITYRTSDSVVLTLPQCIALALKGATDVLKAKNQLDFSGTQLWQAYMEFLPNLEAGANYTWQRGQFYYAQTTPTTVLTTNHGAAYDVTSTLNLFNGFGDAASLRAGQQRHHSATLTLYRAKQQIILDITSAYLQVWLDRDIVDFAQSNLKSSRQRQDLLAAQTEVGSKSLTDFYRQEAQTSSDELFFIQSQNRAREDLILLLRRLRVDLTKNYDLDEAPLDTPAGPNPYTDEAKMLQIALAQRPDLQALKDSAQAFRWDVTTARSGYFPRLDFGVGLDGSGDHLDRQIVNGQSVLPVPQSSLGHQLGNNVVYDATLNLTWGLFDRFITKTAGAHADQISKDAQIDYEDLKLQVEGDVKQSVGDYQAALLQIDVAQRGVQAAQQSFDAIQERYKVGASSILDLLTAQSALVQAQSANAQARIGFVVQERLMENILGTAQIP